MSFLKENVELHVNSSKRVGVGETSSNFTYTINKNITRIQEIVVDNIQIPFTFYTINSLNNVLKFFISPTTYTATITPGNYTLPYLITELQTQINAALGQSPTIIYSQTTMKLTISLPTTAAILLSKASTPTSTLAPLLGFSVDSALSLTLVADSCPNISGPDYIFVKSVALTETVHNEMLFVNNNLESVLCAVPVNTTFGGILNYNPDHIMKLSYKFSILTTDTLDFSLIDIDGNVLDLNGSEWSMQLSLTIS